GRRGRTKGGRVLDGPAPGVPWWRGAGGTGVGAGFEVGAGGWWGWGHWGEGGDGGGGVRGGMGRLVGRLLATLTFIAETTLERRDHAGAPRPRWRADRMCA